MWHAPGPHAGVRTRTPKAATTAGPEAHPCGVKGDDPVSNERGQSSPAPKKAMNRRALKAIERSNATLASSAARLERSEARVRLARGWVERNQAELERSQAAIDRESREHRSRMFNPIYLRSTDPAALRRQFAKLALRLAETEAMIARRHDTLASNLPDRAAECRRIADRAREGERRAHEIAEQFQV